MAILKANGKILKANGKVLCVQDIMRYLLYLTYFSNYDSVNKKDIPLIGDLEIPLKNVSNLLFPKVNLMGYEINSIRWNAYNPSVVKQDAIIIDENIKQISIEYFLSSYYHGDWGTNFALGYLRFAGQGVKNGVNLYIPNGTNAITKFFNGARLDEQWGRWCFLPGPNDWSTHFYSCVVDFENREILFYIDGILVCEVSNINLSRSMSCICDTHRSNHWLNVTQCAIFAFSKNSADKQTYDVPTIPYVIN